MIIRFLLIFLFEWRCCRCLCKACSIVIQMSHCFTCYMWWCNHRPCLCTELCTSPYLEYRYSCVESFECSLGSWLTGVLYVHFCDWLSSLKAKIVWLVICKAYSFWKLASGCCCVCVCVSCHIPHWLLDVLKGIPVQFNDQQTVIDVNSLPHNNHNTLINPFCKACSSLSIHYSASS